MLPVAEFYERTSWPVGTLVTDAARPQRRGTIVARGGRIWANRDKLPKVRWHNPPLIDAEQIPWERLRRVA